ncbi:FAD:protein FMN transferase [Lysobacter terrae]
MGASAALLSEVPRREGGALQRVLPLLGTFVAIRIDACAKDPEVAIEAAFARIDGVHRAMSFHDAGSELSRLNRDAAASPQRVGADVWRVLRASLAFAHASEARFDPTVAGRLVRSGHLPHPDAPAPDPAATWRDVDLLRDQRVRFRRPLWLDFGGIAKGYAVDLAVAALRANGAESGVVNAGGDLRAFGATQEVVHVRDPRDPARAMPLLQLREGALATSAGYFSTNHGRSALVDTRGDTTLGHGVSISVCAPRAIWADALTKVVASDAADAVPLLRRLHAQAALVDATGGVRTLS